MKKLRIIIADDHKFITESLRGLLEPQYEVVETVEDGYDLVTQAVKLKPDIAVVDISMPRLNGFEAALRMGKEGLKTKIIFLTMHPDVSYAARAMKVGASAYVLKHSAPTELIEAIEKVHVNQTYITPSISEQLHQGNFSGKSPINRLTPRQREVLQLVVEGKSAKEVAETLYVSPRTVEFHKYKIIEELGLKSSTELIQYAIKNGIVSI